MDAKPQTLSELAEQFGFGLARLERIVERRQISPVEIRGIVALFDAREIQLLIKSLPDSTRIVRAR
jgi:hypothetical protein